MFMRLKSEVRNACLCDRRMVSMFRSPRLKCSMLDKRRVLVGCVHDEDLPK